MIRIAIAVALAAAYAAICRTWGGLHSGGAFAGWFFTPAFTTLGAGLLAMLASHRTASPWRSGGGKGPAPRRVRLSWRAVFGTPAAVPALFLAGNILAIVRLHAGRPALALAAIALALGALAWLALRRAREYRLLRAGDIATATVHHRETSDEAADRVFYRFTSAGGTHVSSHARFAGERLDPGDDLTVYYEPGEPANHVAACATWFEAA